MMQTAPPVPISMPNQYNDGISPDMSLRGSIPCCPLGVYDSYFCYPSTHAWGFPPLQPRRLCLLWSAHALRDYNHCSGLRCMPSQHFDNFGGHSWKEVGWSPSNVCAYCLLEASGCLVFTVLANPQLQETLSSIVLQRDLSLQDHKVFSSSFFCLLWASAKSVTTGSCKASRLQWQCDSTTNCLHMRSLQSICETLLVFSSVHSLFLLVSWDTRHCWWICPPQVITILRPALNLY